MSPGKRRPGRPKETPDDVVAALHAEGVSREVLARAFKKHPNTIDKALRRAKVSSGSDGLHALVEKVRALQRPNGHFTEVCEGGACTAVCQLLQEVVRT